MGSKTSQGAGSVKSLLLRRSTERRLDENQKAMLHSVRYVKAKSSIYLRDLHYRDTFLCLPSFLMPSLLSILEGEVSEGVCLHARLEQIVQPV